MKHLPLLLLAPYLLLASCSGPSGNTPNIPEYPTLPMEIKLTAEEANRLSSMALHCMQQEYPNKLGQVLGNASYLASPRELHPAFYGCFDWHSAVHGHWSLVRILKKYPNIAQAQEIRTQISLHFTDQNIATEVAYFNDEHNKNYERTYGWAWLLKLVEELDTWADPQGQQWRETLRPLENLIVNKYLEFLPKLTYPIRVGEHPNTAFGLAFAWDYANTTGHRKLKELIEQRAYSYYQKDSGCPNTWEPGGFDFLSPCLEEADIMARVMDDQEFARWFADFLPTPYYYTPAEVSDRTDGKLVHLDGLNFSRAWVLYHLARKLPEHRESFNRLADVHMAKSLAKMTSGDYAGEHWLASFALYALSAKEE